MIAPTVEWQALEVEVLGSKPDDVHVVVRSDAI